MVRVIVDPTLKRSTNYAHAVPDETTVFSDFVFRNFDLRFEVR